MTQADETGLMLRATKPDGRPARRLGDMGIRVAPVGPVHQTVFEGLDAGIVRT